MKPVRDLLLLTGLAVMHTAFTCLSGPHAAEGVWGRCKVQPIHLNTKGRVNLSSEHAYCGKFTLDKIQFGSCLNCKSVPAL